MKTLFVLLVIIHCSDSMPYTSSHRDNGGLRLCVPDSVLIYTSQMFTNASGQSIPQIHCVSAPDRTACIDQIINGNADWTILDSDQLYIAYKYLPEKRLVITSEIRSKEYSTRDYRYGAVAVIRRSSQILGISDLKGKRSCHTGFRKTTGWKIPFSQLLAKHELKNLNLSLNAMEREIASVKNYFGPACVPGVWNGDPKEDKILKEKYSQLCELCKKPETCGTNDPYAGYNGALKCLTENEGDIAWTKFDAVRNFFNLSESPINITHEYALLCNDNKTMSLTSKNPCTWAKRPWRTIVMTHNFSEKLDVIKDLQEVVTSLRMETPSAAPTWLKKVLDLNKDFDVEFHHDPQRVKVLTPQNYVRPTNYSQSVWHSSCDILEKRSLRICAFNQVEFQRCNALRLSAILQKITPEFSCVVGTRPDQCSTLVANGDADLIVGNAVGAESIENSERLTPKLTPILREVEPTDKEGEFVPFKFALAVIRGEVADEFQGSLSPLRGKKSCHGSVNILAAWNAPLGVLRDAGEITGENCDLPQKLSKYFDGGCAPGSRGKMCSLCVGNEKGLNEMTCEDDPNGRYYGSAGALRCLTDEVADVAFVDHRSILEIVKGGNGTEEGKLKLLCRNGTVTSLSEFRSCHWGMLPTLKILARAGEKEMDLRESARKSLLRAQELFRRGGWNEKAFKLFGSDYGTSKVIFQDDLVGFEREFEEEAREIENKIIRDFNHCKSETSQQPITATKSLR